MEKFNIQLGERIKEVREINNLTQEEFASEIGISVQQLYRIEKGFTGTNTNVLKKIVNKYKISSDYLLNESDSKIITHKESDDLEEKKEIIKGIIDLCELYKNMG